MTLKNKLFKNKKTLKNENISLKKEIEKLNQENNKLKNELISVNNKYHNLRYIRSNEKNASSFCSHEFIDYYFSDDFEEKFQKMVKNLPKESKDYFKWLLLRVLIVNFNGKESLFSDSELLNQKNWVKFEKNNVKDNKIGKYTFEGDYNLHGFIDLNLTDDEKEFLKNKDIIDAGAFTGDTAIPLSEITENQVYAFEPFEDSFELMVKNIKINEKNNICPVNKSLGDINGKRKLFLSKNNFQGITFDSELRNYDQELVVEETTIDSFVSENKLDVGLITVDVEGAEKNLLNGAVETIKSQKPVLFISIYHGVEDFFEIKPWIEELDLGYEFEIVKEQPWTFVADTVLKCKINNKNH
ncbi:FkbM family methyltransferase [uncultured Methanobrevibacter sp.]|uniref:FkbM family methyltransferase n=1 Tax=uncultured Methanobrevibacter sp. TaxID=253161 RepID=UPI002639E6FB|nr:FkbM family methyltransferase [uncultured Methanobrevibacter sp.]